jgi:hypothetical protein
MEDSLADCPKEYAELLNVLEAQPAIEEMGFSPSFDPPFILFIENKLGISVTVLKPLLQYAIVQFRKLYPSFHELIEIESGHSHVQIESDKIQRIFSNISQVTSVMLTIRLNLPMALNVRKILIENGHLDCNKELSLLLMWFTQHPKSPAGENLSLY